MCVKNNAKGSPMETATVGEVQKNFAEVLRKIASGESIIVTKRGRPVAKITALGARKDIDWPDFYQESIELDGKPLSDIVIDSREDRF
jgi:prevent-host-death family protein